MQHERAETLGRNLGVPWAFSLLSLKPSDEAGADFRALLQPMGLGAEGRCSALIPHGQHLLSKAGRQDCL